MPPFKLYLAGPEVFLPNAVAYAKWQLELCKQYGFIGLHPMDNNIDLGDKDMSTALRIYHGDIGQIRQCDIIVANCNSFRGALIDDGTAYELGYGNALGKISYGYIDKLIPWKERILSRYVCVRTDSGMFADKEGYLLVDDFSTSINLMMQCGMLARGGRLIEGGFEDCLLAISSDLALRMPVQQP